MNSAINMRYKRIILNYLSDYSDLFELTI